MSTADPAAPSAAVLAAFGLTGRPERLAGGQGRSFGCGDAVLKPVDDPAELAWTAPLLSTLPVHGFRLARPIPTRSGGWDAHGWTATERISGRPGPVGHWPELLAAATALHTALQDVPKPDTLERRTDRWAVADRYAWGEQQIDPLPPVVPLLRHLQDRLRPLRLPRQLIHADLAGNVLFDAGRPPAIIDFTPYWRPVDYAAAVVAVDGLLWWGAGPELLELAWSGPEFGQVMLRALMFRLMDLNGRAGQEGSAVLTELPEYWSAADQFLAFWDDYPG